MIISFSFLALVLPKRFSWLLLPQCPLCSLQVSHLTCFLTCLNFSIFRSYQKQTLFLAEPLAACLDCYAMLKKKVIISVLNFFNLPGVLLEINVPTYQNSRIGSAHVWHVYIEDTWPNKLGALSHFKFKWTYGIGTIDQLFSWTTCSW